MAEFISNNFFQELVVELNKLAKRKKIQLFNLDNTIAMRGTNFPRISNGKITYTFSIIPDRSGFRVLMSANS